MDVLIVIAILAAVAWWAHRHGKRLGSRKGFYVGLIHGRRRPATRRRPR